MHVELSPRQVSLRVYEREGDLDYVASAQVVLYGDRGFMYSINGRGFYGALDHVLWHLSGLGLSSVEGYVGAAHYRLLRRVLRGLEWAVEIGEVGKMAGRDLIWIVIRRKT